MKIVASLGLGIALTTTSMAYAQDHDMESVTLNDIRGMRFCEILLIFDDRVDIYNTSASNDCPADKWSAMDVTSIAANHGAKAAQLNGPKFWAADGQTVEFAETKTFGGIDARYAASLPTTALGGSEGTNAYAHFTSSKKQTLVFKAGQPIYELIDLMAIHMRLMPMGRMCRAVIRPTSPNS